MMMMTANPAPVIVAGCVLWVCAFALIDYFYDKDAMVRLNE